MKRWGLTQTVTIRQTKAAKRNHFLPLGTYTKSDNAGGRRTATVTRNVHNDKPIRRRDAATLHNSWLSWWYTKGACTNSQSLLYARNTSRTNHSKRHADIRSHQWFLQQMQYQTEESRFYAWAWLCLWQYVNIHDGVIILPVLWSSLMTPLCFARF